MDFIILMDHEVKIKESENMCEYLDLSIELIKQTKNKKKPVKRGVDDDTSCS